MTAADSAGAPDTAETGIPPLLADWIVGQRWFTNTASHRLERLAAWSLPADGATVRTLLLADTAAGAEALYQVPLVTRATATDPIGPDGDGVLVDGPRDPAFVAGLLALVLGGGIVDDGEVQVEGVPIGWTGPAPTVVSAKVLSGEQSNTSIIVETQQPDGGAGPGVIVKVFRALHDGENPDVVLQSAIAAAGSSRVPATFGALVGEWPDAHTPGGRARGHLAVAQEFLAGTEDAWRVALQAAREGRDFTGPARDLGAATAEVHRVLADVMPTAEADDAAKAATAASMRSRAARAAALVPSLGAAEGAIDRVLDAGAGGAWPTLQRVHGDYHLGQVLLVPDRGWVLLDFEGEPLRPMSERNLPDLPLRDVAGMLRSFDYVAGTIELEGGDADAARVWADAARAAFLEGCGFDATDATTTRLLAALELDKALYECVYEARNRPAWLPIPERAVHRLLGTARA